MAIITAQIKPNPKREPALVLWTKCDTPIAVLANRIPGPNVLSMFFLLIMNFYSKLMFSINWSSWIKNEWKSISWKKNSWCLPLH